MEVQMVLLKALFFLIAGMVAAMMVRSFMGQLSAQKARVHTPRQGARQTVRRLRQDPRTGVYYPEE